ncbi:hypothetical protein B0H34DRAFT_857690 [Crassisporium funariophilum]|nr:hypothetical protein B0H34DRAFT_857690 [Crassisporium funariophilum]
MDDLSSVIKVVNNGGNPRNIRRIFSAVGEEPDLYPLDNDVPGESHCFLRFSSPELASRAYELKLKLALEDVSVYSVHRNPLLVEQYRKANPLGCVDKRNSMRCSGAMGVESDETKISTELDRHPVAARRRMRRGRRNQSRPIRDHGISNAVLDKGEGEHDLNMDSRCTSRSNSSISVSYLRFPSTAPPIARLCETPRAPVHHNLSDVTIRPPSERPSASVLEKAYPVVPAGHVSSFESALSTLTCPISSETRISMNLCGEVITYDLNGLESDPRVIIELLKATKSERANWMIVAAFYRRQGQPKNGLSVIQCMIEEMETMGIAEDGYRPAFLLAAGCETDLAKLAKSGLEPDSVISQHYDLARNWLDKVYGKVGINKRKRSGDVDQKATPSSVLGKETGTLEREVQSLRDRHNHQEKQLSQLRSMARKLEDSYKYERDLRHKYQGQLEELEQKCHAARKMENYALEQIKREVAARRKAEETEKALRLQMIGETTTSVR